MFLFTLKKETSKNVVDTTFKIENLDWTDSHEKETKHSHTSAANLLHIRIENFDLCKCGHWKNETREIDCLCCRQVDAMLIASAKILECEGNISQCSFFGKLSDC